MASRWIVNKQGGAVLSFGELVALVRSGEITEDDLVKAEWEPDWRPARTVVGLFYRVRQQSSHPASESPVACTPSSQVSAVTEFAFEDLNQTLLEDAEISEAHDQEVSWQRRVRELAVAQLSHDAEDSPPETTEVRLLVQAALEETRSAPRQSLFDRCMSRAEAVGSVVWSVRSLWLLAGMVLAALTCWGVLSYSRLLAYRFPRPGSASGYSLPLFGNLIPGDLWLIVVDIAIVVMAVFWIGGRWLGDGSTSNSVSGSA